MTPRSAADWSTDWPRACSATSTATGAGSWRARRALRRALAALPLAAAIVWVGGCGYVNTFYNAERAFDEGVRLSAASRDSLPAPAREAFERAAEKSGIVLARYADSRYADDALLLLGNALARLGRHDDAAAAFRRYLDRFPEADGVTEARLRLARSERLRGDRPAARLALTPLLQPEDGDALPAEVLYERAMLDLATDQHAAAVEGFREILERHPDFAREHKVALAFAEAELAAEDYDAALDAYAAYREGSPDAGARQEVALRVARALALAERPAEALTTYAAILSDRLADTLAARVNAERGEILAGQDRTAEAEEAYRRVAELAPGTPVAAMATLKRGRLVWREGGRRQEALEILLDAFLHAPTSAFSDSARAEARALAEVIHFERLAAGDQVVAEIDDPDVVRSTALYRLAEEVLDAESDPAAAAELFRRLAEGYPQSPWRPRALLAVGMLERTTGNVAEGETALRSVIELYPDTPEADSARRILGDSLPARPADFYAPSSDLASLAAALPEAEDPMVRITDQLDRYAAAREERDDPRSAAGRRREGGQLRPPSEREPERPGSQTDPRGEGRPGVGDEPDRVPLGVEP